KIFAASPDRKPIKLHRHQERAVAKARNDESFIVTTGTGSGKSLCFFVPIVDAVVRARRAGEARRTRAVIIYPMNALANSQLEELEKFIGGSGLEDGLRPTYRRYTGQESDAERQDIAAAKADLLLTNFGHPADLQAETIRLHGRVARARGVDRRSRGGRSDCMSPSLRYFDTAF